MKISKSTAIAALVGMALSISPLVANAQKTTATTTPAKTVAAPAKATTTMSGKVNVNTATVAELETLPGIGPKIAAEIVKNRPYKDGKDLQTKVKGIGPQVWKDIKKMVLFK